MNTNMLRIGDFELTFEGQGVTYLYEGAIYKHYLPSGSVSIVDKGVVKEFMPKRSLEAMNAEGARMTPDRVREAIAAMDRCVAEGREGMEALLAKPLDAEALRQAFKLSGAVTKAYEFFDPHYWDALYARSGTDAAAKEVVSLVQEYKNKAREDFNAFHFADGYMPRLLQKLSEASGVPREELAEYGEDEVIALLSGARAPAEAIAARKDAYAMIKGEGEGFTALSGAEARAFAQAFFSEAEAPAAGESLKGKCAHATGKPVRGIVRVITRDYDNVARMLEQMQAMGQGDILVTQTTDPEMMPALRKAAAAVTDIGGMLSHTAITARELDIPCIVDTKFATQLLKDGDEIEVDAEKGTVKILKRAG